jgi:hypothetical protein
MALFAYRFFMLAGLLGLYAPCCGWVAWWTIRMAQSALWPEPSALVDMQTTFMLYMVVAMLALITLACIWAGLVMVSAVVRDR